MCNHCAPYSEGEMVIVKFSFMYIITIAVLVYEKFIRKKEGVPAPDLSSSASSTLPVSM